MPYENKHGSRLINGPEMIVEPKIEAVSYVYNPDSLWHRQMLRLYIFVREVKNQIKDLLQTWFRIAVVGLAVVGMFLLFAALALGFVCIVLVSLGILLIITWVVLSTILSPYLERIFLYLLS
ncbi:MAG: hypothetical protein WCO10_00500 [bacterium]